MTDPWPYRFFHPHELASPDTGEALMDPAFMKRLDTLRHIVGHPITVTSGYRTAAHNKAVGGAPRSAHLQGRAVDIVVKPTRRLALLATAHSLGFTGVGIAEHFIHLDDLSGDDRTRPSLWLYG